MHINIEFKARCADILELENILLSRNPLFIGTDRQIDTYFKVQNGRLKLREGNIEHALIHYERNNTKGAKQSNVLLYQFPVNDSLKEILAKSLGIKTIVDKTRRIYFIDNVKFHFDIVRDLGSFVEVEAIDKDGSIGVEHLQDQCAFYAQLFGIASSQYMAESYCDLLLAKISSID